MTPKALSREETPEEKRESIISIILAFICLAIPFGMIILKFGGIIN